VAAPAVQGVAIMRAGLANKTMRTTSRCFSQAACLLTDRLACAAPVAPAAIMRGA